MGNLYGDLEMKKLLVFLTSKQKCWKGDYLTIWAFDQSWHSGIRFNSKEPAKPKLLAPDYLAEIDEKVEAQKPKAPAPTKKRKTKLERALTAKLGMILVWLLIVLKVHILLYGNIPSESYVIAYFLNRLS